MGGRGARRRAAGRQLRARARTDGGALGECGRARRAPVRRARLPALARIRAGAAGRAALRSSTARASIAGPRSRPGARSRRTGRAEIVADVGFAAPVPAAAAPLVAGCDGRRTLGELVAETGVAAAAALEAARRLVGLGFLVPAE